MQSVFFNGRVIAFNFCGKTEKIASMSLSMNGVIYSGCCHLSKMETVY